MVDLTEKNGIKAEDSKFEANPVSLHIKVDVFQEEKTKGPLITFGKRGKCGHVIENTYQVRKFTSIVKQKTLSLPLNTALVKMLLSSSQKRIHMSKFIYIS